jgi:hypothetical protein
MTVPSGVPDGEFTLAVNFTDCPKTEGFSAETKVVVVASLDPVLFRNTATAELSPEIKSGRLSPFTSETATEYVHSPELYSTTF